MDINIILDVDRLECGKMSMNLIEILIDLYLIKDFSFFPYFSINFNLINLY